MRRALTRLDAGQSARTEERESMAVRVGINGFGRIGRNFFRALNSLGADVEIVALNDLGDANTMAHLLSYDSNLGPFPGPVELGDGVIRAGGQEMKMLSERDPAALPWGDLGVEVVLESTGFFTDARGGSEASRRRARRRSSSRRPRPTPTSRSCSASTTTSTTPRRTTSSRTPRARRTASRRWPRSSTSSPGSSPAS